MVENYECKKSENKYLYYLNSNKNEEQKFLSSQMFS